MSPLVRYGEASACRQPASGSVKMKILHVLRIHNLFVLVALVPWTAVHGNGPVIDTVSHPYIPQVWFHRTVEHKQPKHPPFSLQNRCFDAAEYTNTFSDEA
jgi:hypothetical protein